MRAGRFRFQVHILVKSKMVKAFCCSLVRWIENGCILVWLLSILPKRWIGGEGLNNGPFVIKNPPCLTNHGWYQWMPPLNALWLSCPTVTPCICVFSTLDRTRGRQRNTQVWFLQVISWCNSQLGHDGQVQPQESITEEQRQILDTALWGKDEK